MTIYVLSNLRRLARKARRAKREALDNPPMAPGEGFQRDGSFLNLHPTKGFRRIGPKRLAIYGKDA